MIRPLKRQAEIPQEVVVEALEELQEIPVLEDEPPAPRQRILAKDVSKRAFFLRNMDRTCQRVTFPDLADRLGATVREVEQIQVGSEVVVPRNVLAAMTGDHQRSERDRRAQ